MAKYKVDITGVNTNELIVLSKIIMIILKGHYKEVNSSVKLHSKLIKGFIKNNYELMLKNINIQMLFFLFKLDIFLIKETDINFVTKKNKKIKTLINNENSNEKNKQMKLINENKKLNNEKIKNNNGENNDLNNENIFKKFNIEYDEETEIKLNEINKEQTQKKLNENIYWKKHLQRLLLKKYKKKVYIIDFLKKNI